MGNTCPDVCDALIVQMCQPCPNYKQCQNEDHDANHNQMIECINRLKMVDYPSVFEDMDRVQHKTSTDRPTATELQIATAREMYETDDVNIDNDAQTSVGEDGTWIQAWVLLPNDNLRK